MRLIGEPVGRWGLTLMAVTAIVGALLGWHGWSARSAGAIPVVAGAGSPGSARSSAPASPTPGLGGGQSQAATSAPSAGPTPAASTPPAPGPLLSSEPFASAAFQVWPGKPSAAAQQALTGLHVSVKKLATGIEVTAGVNGQAAGQPHLYAGGVRVYVVEASMGDDSGNSDYNLGDDGLVVTDRQGRIIQ